MRSKAWVCEECGNWTTVNRMYVGWDILTADAGGLLCPRCSIHLSPGIHESGRVFGINNAPYRKPLHSDALGVQPDQREEHQKLYPDVELDSENRPVFTHANQHDAYMEKAGIRKDVQKTRRPGEVIAKLGEEGEGFSFELEQDADVLRECERLESEDADRTDAPNIQEEDSEETKDAGRVHEDGLDRLAVADVQ